MNELNAAEACNELGVDRDDHWRSRDDGKSLGDGAPELTGWTNPASGEALLYYDLNGNHQLDGGAALFGEATVLPSGKRAENGFAALAMYDAPSNGGNGDGHISPADRIWGRIRLWIDRSHDGWITNDENYSLAEQSVVRINLDYEEATADELYGLDTSGNYHRLRGTFVGRASGAHGGSLRLRSLHDVYFATLPWERWGVPER